MSTTEFPDAQGDSHGYLNNAGRFRAEVSISTQTGQSTKNALSAYSENGGGSLHFGKPVVFDSAKDETTDHSNSKDRDSIAERLDNLSTNDDNSSTDNIDHHTSPHQSEELNPGPTEDYFVFDFLPYASLSSGSSLVKPSHTPVHLENPEREMRWYFKYFLGKCESECVVELFVL